MVRFAKQQLFIVMIDGVLGAIIGVVSVGFETAAAAVVRDRLPLFLVGTGVTTIMFAIPMFIATVALAPALLAVLRRWSHQPASRYYLKSALAGIVFGLAACAGVGFVTGLTVPFMPGPPVVLTERLMMLAGAPFLLAIGFFFTGFVFWKQMLITGVAFGLFNGWWVRRAWGRRRCGVAEPDQPPSAEPELRRAASALPLHADAQRGAEPVRELCSVMLDVAEVHELVLQLRHPVMEATVVPREVHGVHRTIHHTVDDRPVTKDLLLGIWARDERQRALGIGINASRLGGGPPPSAVGRETRRADRP